ncbi:hypothetical protein NDU88_003348 [Pleurodeles waltl]|uniref:Uncharacterized protein n=1 Tax=Pleurodeles waltl TaxID=8319 RepID=A0AAV7UYP1_PLEWA|nr:hypothetical protein NDU88_003348 [Pleurodeles waltl]
MASHRQGSRLSDLQVGDQVLIQNRFPGSKFQLPFEDSPRTVVRRQGSLVVAQRGADQILWFKQFHAPLPVSDGTIHDNPHPTDSDEASDDGQSEEPLPNSDSGDGGREASKHDSNPDLSPGGLVTAAG